MKITAPPQPPIISVIIPTYNSTETLRPALESVLDQDLVEKEIIIVDGGSTDGTVALLNKYDQQIDCWISEPDNGIYDALNKGIDLANGEWLYFLGSDDKLYDSQVFTDILSHRSKSKMIYGNVIFGADGVLGPSGTIYNGEFTKFKLTKKNICHQAIFYHKDLFIELGEYDKKYPILADFFFNIRAFALKKTSPLFINRIVAIYANQGLSNTEKDTSFHRDRDTLVKTYLGLRIYLLVLFLRSKPIRFCSVLLRFTVRSGKNIVRRMKNLL